MTGTIKVLKINFGFITPTDGSRDVFFHAKSLPANVNFRDLKEGDMLNFDVEETAKGLNAVNINVMNSSKINSHASDYSL